MNTAKKIEVARRLAAHVAEMERIGDYSENRNQALRELFDIVSKPTARLYLREAREAGKAR